MNPKILAIDDEQPVVDSYADILARHGFEVIGATSAAQAIDRLDNGGPWDVVLLDEKLEGPGGPDAAAGLLLEIATRAPSARTLVITGFATPKLVERAIRAGAWDYLEKDAQFLKLLLPLRVRHAVEAARERQFSRMSQADLEGELTRLWVAAGETGATPQQRGRRLEEVLCLLFRTMPGFDDARVNHRGAAEEFDVVVVNRSTDPYFQREGSILLVECKNWSTKAGPLEYEYLRNKVRDRFQRASIGLLVSINGFTAGVDTKLARARSDRELVLPLDGNDLAQWIEAPDRVRWLRERLNQAALRT